MLSMGDVFCGLMMIDGCIWYCYHYYMSDGEYHYKDAGANITYHIARHEMENRRHFYGIFPQKWRMMDESNRFLCKNGRKYRF